MSLFLENGSLKKLIVVGDKLLIRPETSQNKTASGLYLPPGVVEKEKVKSGLVLKVGPGYPIPAIQDDSEAWKQDEEVKYVPLQAKEGDTAVFLHKSSYEIEFNGEKLLIVPHSAILMLVRDDIF